MSIAPHHLSDHHLQLAVFRLDGVCVHVQRGMKKYLRTAALEPAGGVLTVFGWLRKRGVGTCLLSDYDLEATAMLLKRLGWSVGEEGMVQYVVYDQGRFENPVLEARRVAGIDPPRAVVAVVDSPRLLECASAAAAHLGLGICNGRSTYAELAVAPHHGMLDELVQLPDFLLRHLPVGEGAAVEEGTAKLSGREKPSVGEGAGPQVQRRLRLPRLRLPRTLFG